MGFEFIVAICMALVELNPNDMCYFHSETMVQIPMAPEEAHPDDLNYDIIDGILVLFVPRGASI
jgi:hypothetical protein